MRVIIFLLISFSFFGCTKKIPRDKPEFKFTDGFGLTNKKEAHFYWVAPNSIKKVFFTDENCQNIKKELVNDNKSDKSFLRLNKGLNVFYLQVLYKNQTKRCFGKSIAVYDYQPVFDVKVEAYHQGKFLVKSGDEEKECIRVCYLKVREGEEVEAVMPSKIKGLWSKNCRVFGNKCVLSIQKHEKVEYSKGKEN